MTINTEYGNIGVVHAESADNWDDNGFLHREANRWARTRIKCLQDQPIKNIDMLVVGHTPTKEVLRLANIVYIDTGACFKEAGVLTMLSVEEVFNGDFKRVGRPAPQKLTEEQELALEAFNKEYKRSGP